MEKEKLIKLSIVTVIFILIAGGNYYAQKDISFSPDSGASGFDYFYMVLGVLWAGLTVFIIFQNKVEHAAENPTPSNFIRTQREVAKKQKKIIADQNKSIKLQEKLVKKQKIVEKRTKKVVKVQKQVEKRAKKIENKL